MSPARPCNQPAEDHSCLAASKRPTTARQRQWVNPPKTWHSSNPRPRAPLLQWWSAASHPAMQHGWAGTCCPLLASWASKQGMRWVGFHSGKLLRALLETWQKVGDVLEHFLGCPLTAEALLKVRTDLLQCKREDFVILPFWTPLSAWEVRNTWMQHERLPKACPLFC